MLQDILTNAWYQEFVKAIQTPEGLAHLQENLSKDLKDVKSSIILTQDFTGIEVAALVSATSEEEYDRNTMIEISCKRGKPLSHCCYNIAKDCFVVYGVDYIFLGEVPVNYQLEIQGAYEFLIDIPLPEKVILRYLSEQQHDRLRLLRKSYPKESYKIEFLQMLKVSIENDE